MKDRTFDTTSQTEAMLNELKGNLFEYLVAVNLSRLNHIEAEFIKNFTGQAKNQFVQYESWVRNNAPYLIEKLPALAQDTALEIQKTIKEDLKNIYVVGKQVAENAKTRGMEEGDLLLEYTSKKLVAISLKLCKSNAFVNTKSGGVRSFIEKYFKEFPSTGIDQSELNSCVDESFQLMGHRLYELAGLQFSGSFDGRWSDAGMSELPGQLNEEQREVVLESYQMVIGKLYDLMKEMYESDPQQFFLCLQRLMGFSADSIQVICTYTNEKNESYKLKRVYLSDSDSINSLQNSMQFGELKPGIL